MLQLALWDEQCVSHWGQVGSKNESKLSLEGVGVLGALDDSPGGHQLHERPACEEHHLEVFIIYNFLAEKKLEGISFIEHNLEVCLMSSFLEETKLGAISFKEHNLAVFLVRNTTWVVCVISFSIHKLNIIANSQCWMWHALSVIFAAGVLFPVVSQSCCIFAAAHHHQHHHQVVHEPSWDWTASDDQPGDGREDDQ